MKSTVIFKNFLFLCLFFSKNVTSFAAQNNFKFISIETNNYSMLVKKVKFKFNIIRESKTEMILKVGENELSKISQELHKLTGHCGGYMVIEADEINTNHDLSLSKSALRRNFKYYLPSFNQFIKDQIYKVNTEFMMKTIESLSTFPNRHYKTSSGVNSQLYIRKIWSELTARLGSIAHVDLFYHKNFPQPSVILTIEGSKSNEEIIIGGHGDSVNWKDSSKGIARAPGADDNASGISVLTEIVRVLVDSGFRPERTIKVMAYAGEEEGLLGSQNIAKTYRNLGKKVLGVIQFDMVNYTGKKYDVVFIKDRVDPKLNNFVVDLLNLYVPNVTYSFDTNCGACSDHASWHKYGYSSSFPYESKLREGNPFIHTKRDTIRNFNNNGEHAKIFAQLGLAFVLELSKL